MASLLVVHGPNLNRLGSREPERYGSRTLNTIDQRLAARAEAAGHQLESFQANGEQALIERVHAAADAGVAAAICNPAALTHTSIALRDAWLASTIPFIEVHLSNIHARESFRQTSFFADIARGTITGLGDHGYDLALEAIIAELDA